MNLKMKMGMIEVNIDKVKLALKNNPRTGILILTITSLRDRDKCKNILDLVMSPYVMNVQRTSGTKASDKWIYFINLDKEYQYNGFCSIIKMLLYFLSYAECFDFAPIVFIGSSTMYYEQNIGENVFEYYFDPVSNYNYKDILQYKKVVCSKPYDIILYGKIGGYDIPSEEEIEFMGNVYKKYMKLNKRTKKSFEKFLEEIAKYKTIGVHVRSTDFNKGYNRHPIAVEPSEYLEKTIEIFNSKDYEKVFLATDDADVISLFQKNLGDKLIYYKDTYRSCDGKAIHYNNGKIKRKNHKYLLGLEIIKDYYTLGYCDGLISGNSNVSICARIIKYTTEKKYEDMVIIDKGINHNLKNVRSPFNNMLKS